MTGPGPKLDHQATTLCNQAAGYQEIVQAMQAAGWYRTSGGIVAHLDHGDFPGWQAAIFACIHIASKG